VKTQRYALIDWVYRKSTSVILATVILIYAGLGLFFGGLYLGLQEFLSLKVVESVQPTYVFHWSDYFYFSFVTQTTVGYGDFNAVGLGKFFTPIQAIFGLFLVFLIIPLVIVKLWSPKDSLVFAREAECIIEDERKFAHFGFRCANTHKLPLYDVRILCFFFRQEPKSEVYGTLNEQIPVYPNILPNMGKAVWYFHSAHDDKTGFKLYNLIRASDVFKFKVLVVGSYGTSPYSIVREFKGEDLVGGHYIRISEEPDGSEEFERDFHRVGRLS